MNTEITCLNDVRGRGVLRFQAKTRNEFRRRLEALIRLWRTTSKPNILWFKTIHRLMHLAIHPARILQFENISNLVDYNIDDICAKEASDFQSFRNLQCEHQLIYYLTDVIYEELTGSRAYLEELYGVNVDELRNNASSVFMHPLFYNDGEAIARLRNPQVVKEELYIKQFRIRDEYKTRVQSLPNYKLFEIQVKELREREEELRERERLFAVCFNSAPAIVQEIYRRQQQLAYQERAFNEEVKNREMELEKKYEAFDNECEEYELNSTRWKAQQEHLYLEREARLNEREARLNEIEAALKIETTSVGIQTYSESSSSELTEFKTPSATTVSSTSLEETLDRDLRDEREGKTGSSATDVL